MQRDQNDMSLEESETIGYWKYGFQIRTATMIVRLHILLFLSLCATSPAADIQVDELLQHALRFPVATIPLIERAPAVDGKVDDAEWAGAAALPDFMTLDARRHEGVAPRYRTRVWLQYDREALYIAVRAEYPDWVKEDVAVSTKHDETSGREAHFDFFLNPGVQWDAGEFWHFCGNPTGVLFERHLANHALGMAWNPAIEYKARLLMPGWEGEYKVPFKALEVATPKPGHLWRANVFFVRQRPSVALSTWSPWFAWRQTEGGTGYGWWQFGGDNAAVRFEQGVDLADRVAPTIRVVEPADAAVESSVELLRRTDAFTPENPGMIMNLTRWYSERNVGGSASFGASMDYLNKEVLKQFEPVGAPVTRELRAGADTSTLALPVTPELGEYLVRYRFVRKGGTAPALLAAGALSYRVRPQLSIELKPWWLTSKQVAVTVDCSNLRDLDKAKRLKLEVRPKQGDAVIFERTAEIAGSEPITTSIPAEKLPRGSYSVGATVLDAANGELAKLSADLVSPDRPAWWVHPVGENPEVPKPWTPVQWKDGKVDVLGRTYTFSGQPVPSVVKITPTRYSTGEPEQKPVDLLAAPMSLQLRAGGKPVTLQAEPLRVAERRPSMVVLESLNTAGDVTIKGRTTVEFDGMIRVDLEIGPKGDQCKIDGLDFVIPFKEEHAKLLGNFKNAPGPGKVVPRYLGALPTLPWTFPVFYAQTLGTDRYGLQWMCDSTRDWRLSKPDQAVELRKAGSRVEEVFKLIDYPVELTRPLRITFGLMALPVKPLPSNWGRLRITSSLPATPAAGNAAATSEWKRWAGYVKPEIAMIHNPGWSGTPWYPYPFQDKTAEAEFRRLIDLYHEDGIRYCPHSGWQAISTLIPEWTTYGKEMAIEPETESIGKTMYACYNSPYSEFTASLWQQHARTLGIDGIKPDTMFPQTPCASLHHDCGWRDEKGRLWPNMSLFATREFFKRLYREFYEGVKTNGVLAAAQTGVPIAPICSFTSIAILSEGSPYSKARSLKEGYPQDLVRSIMVGAPHGLISIHDLKGAPLNSNQRIAALLVAGGDPRFMADPGNYQRSYIKWAPGEFVYNAPCVDIWDAWDWIDRGGKAIWMPHWENAKVLTVKPATTAEMYGSMHVQPGKKILLVVANYEQAAVAADVAFDLAALGFKGKTVMRAEDAVTKVPLEIKDGSLRIGVQGERYKLIKIWDGEPARHADERLGPNLLAAGDFENWPTGQHSVHPPHNQKEPCVTRDTERAFEGKASLRLEKIERGFHNGQGNAIVELTPVTLEPGDYVVRGRILAEQNFGAPLEGENERPNSGVAEVYVNGAGLEYDPPVWASRMTGHFTVEEKTPGWDRFLIAFRVTEKAQPVTVLLSLGGVGRVWFDDVTLRKVRMVTGGPDS